MRQQLGSARHFLRLWVCLTLVAVFGPGCVSPPEPDPQSATVWGYVRLVPKANAASAGGGYGDRRLANVKRVDYSHTKYAVVFSPTPSAHGRVPLEFVVRRGYGGPQIIPPFASASLAAGIRVRNETDEYQILSAPGAGWLERLAPGQSAEIDELSAGELTVHLLGLPAAKQPISAQVWIAAGIIAEVEPSGRYTIRDLDAGPLQLRAWHPRLPPSAIHEVDLSRGRVQRVDFEIGVDAADLASGEDP
jgi:hypothetical protein